MKENIHEVSKEIFWKTRSKIIKVMVVVANKDKSA